MRLRDFFLAVLVMVSSASMALGMDRNIVFYQVGAGGNQAAITYAKQYFEGKGCGVVILQGEREIEKHLEKVNKINRGQYDMLVALHLMAGDRKRVMVSETSGNKGEGRFLTVDEVPTLFLAESDKLAEAVAGVFKVKVKHMPLFPLLGVNMAGILVWIEGSDEDVKNGINILYTGIDKYLTERTNR